MLYIDFTSTEEQSSNDSKDQNYSFFHSTIILSTKNFPNSSSGRSADSRSRNWGREQEQNSTTFTELTDTPQDSQDLFVSLYSLLLQTNCHNQLSRLTIDLRLELLNKFFFVVKDTSTPLTKTSIKYFKPQGFHPLCIREVSKVSSSCIVSIKKEIKIWFLIPSISMELKNKHSLYTHLIGLLLASLPYTREW